MTNPFDSLKIQEELNSLYKGDIYNGIPPETAIVHVAGILHDRLSLIIRYWQVHKLDEVNKDE